MSLDVRILKETKLDSWLSARQKLWPTSTESELLKDLKHQLQSDKFIAWAIWQDDSIIGFLELYIRSFANGCTSQPVPFLEAIWVDPKWRNKGVGRELLEVAEKWASSNGFDEMGSDADLDNITSHKAHEAWGFSETERVVYFRKALGKH